MLGGTTDGTTFNSMDMDTDGNFIIGGGCADSEVIDQIHNNTEPCLVYIVSGGWLKWGKSFTMQDDFNYVAVVKFSINGDRIVLSFDWEDSIYYKIVILNSLDGSIYRIYRDSASSPVMGLLNFVIDSSYNVYVAR